MSKRFDTYPGIKTKRCSRKVAAIIDTSGSVGDAELAMFFSELRGLLCDMAEITIIECDVQVQRIYRFTGSIPEFVAGRGGTSFYPAFKWLNEHASHQFDVCLYLTDGYAEMPLIRPKPPVLWLLTPDGVSEDHFKWGKIVRLPGK